MGQIGALPSCYMHRSDEVNTLAQAQVLEVCWRFFWTILDKSQHIGGTLKSKKTFMNIKSQACSHSFGHLLWCQHYSIKTK